MNNGCYARYRHIPQSEGLCIIKNLNNPFGTDKLIECLVTQLREIDPIENYTLQRIHTANSFLILFRCTEPNIYQYAYISLRNKLILSTFLVMLVILSILTASFWVFWIGILIASLCPKKSVIEVDMSNKTITAIANNIVRKEEIIITFDNIDTYLVSSVDTYFYPHIVQPLIGEKTILEKELNNQQKI